TEELITRLGARVPPWTRVSRCGRLRAIGDLDAADSRYTERLAVGRAEGDPLLEIASCRNRAEVLLDRRRYADAGPLLVTALEISTRTGERWNRTELTASSALVAAGIGDVGRADRLLVEARDLVRPSDVYAAAFVAASEARVRQIEGRKDDAAAKFRESLGLLSQTEFYPLQAVVHLDYAELLLSMGRAADAAQELAPGERLFGVQVGSRAARIEAFRDALGARKG